MNLVGGNFMLLITYNADAFIHHTLHVAKGGTFGFWVLAREAVISEAFFTGKTFGKTLSQGSPPPSQPILHGNL